MPSQQEGGTLTDVLGPIRLARGMNASAPVPNLGPETPENLWNVDIDRNGRATARPGSVFYSRIGEGPVLGLYEHTFESGIRERKAVAVVRDAYDEVNTRADPDEDGVVTHSVAFCPDIEANGTKMIPMPAGEKDRIIFESFLNRVWIAGSTADHSLRFYDYSTGEFGTVDGLDVLSVVAQGNRLFAAGDPAAPNLVYPSDPDTPESFNPDIALQVGDRNDRIRCMIETEGMILVLTDRSAHWLLVGAIEIGDVQTERISRVHGVTGPLAAAEGSDGWVYWLSKQGPIRWRRGMGSIDMDFNADALELFQNAAGGDLSSAVVYDDPRRDCIRFSFPSGSAETPDYLMSYFYRHGAWTHGARTSETMVAARLRSGTAPLDRPIGDPLYTCMAYREDPLDGQPGTLSGSEEGTIWRSRSFSRERARASAAGQRGTEFKCQVRFGPLELAPSGYRGQIHDIVLDWMTGPQFEFEVFSEVDYEGRFLVADVCSQDLAGGDLADLVLGDDEDARLMDHRFHPVHARIGMWQRGLGKIVRIQVQWEASKAAMAFTGMEVERSLASEPIDKLLGADLENLLGPLDPGDQTVEFTGTIETDDDEGTGGDGDEPHDPPEEEDPPDVSIVVHAHELDNNVSFFNVADKDAVTNITTEAMDGGPCALTVDESHYISATDLGSRIRSYDVSDPFNPVIEWSVNWLTGTLGGDGQGDVRGMYYSRVSNQLLIGARIVNSTDPVDDGSFIIAYDLPDVSQPPTHAFTQVLPTSANARVGEIRLLSDGRTGFVGLASGDFGGFNRPAVLSFRIGTLGQGMNILDTISVATEDINPVGVHLGLKHDESLLVSGAGVGSSAFRGVQLRVIDISNPSSLAVTHELTDENLGGGSNEPKEEGVCWGIGPTADRIFVYLDELDGDPAIGLFDSELNLLGHWTEVSNFPGLGVTTIVADPAGEVVYWGGRDDFILIDAVDESTFANRSAASTLGERFIATPFGPNSHPSGIDPGAFVPLPANLAFGYSNDGKIAFISLDSPSNPTLTGFAFGGWVDGGIDTFNDGEDVVVVTPRARLLVYGRSAFEGILEKKADMPDLRFDGAKWIEAVATPTGYTAWTMNASNELVEIDLSDPRDPQIVSVTSVDNPIVDLYVDGLAERGDLIAGRGYGLTLISKSSGKVLGSASQPQLQSIAEALVDGTTGYAVSDGGGGTFLTVVDLSNYRQKPLGWVQLPGASVTNTRVVKDGDTVYVILRNTDSAKPAIMSVDVTDPANPALLDTLNVGSGSNQLARLWDAAVSGTELWTGGQSVARIDISNPASLSIIENHIVGDLGDAVRACDVGGGHLIGASVDFGDASPVTMVAYDMSGVPSLVDTLNIGGSDPGTPQGLVVYDVGGTDHAAVGLSGNSPGGSRPRIFCIDVSDPAGVGMSVAGSTPDDGTDPDHVEGANLENFYMDPDAATAVFIGANQNHPYEPLNIFDLSVPSSPSKFFGDPGGTGAEEYQKRPNAGPLDGAILWVGRDRDGGGGVAKLDITDPENPVYEGDTQNPYIGTGGGLFRCKFSSENLFALSTTVPPRILQVDISDPEAPRELDGTDLSGSESAIDFAVNWDGTHAAIIRIGGPGTRIEIWDISTISGATKVGEITLGNIYARIRRSGDGLVFVLLGAGSGHVAVIDATTPASPTLVGDLHGFAGSDTFFAHELRLW